MTKVEKWSVKACWSAVLFDFWKFFRIIPVRVRRRAPYEIVKLGLIGLFCFLVLGSRDASKVREFRRLNPCPATHQSTGPCPGWVVDHIIPLCLGGPDAPHNMQWQTANDAKAKDALEYRACRDRKQ